MDLSICGVCETKGVRLHYGALCCAVCKRFFRRNAQFDINNQQCVFKGNCVIRRNNRRRCQYCRMKKCLSIGMQKELLRPPHSRKNTPVNEKTICVTSTIHPLDLLQNDRSLLTVEQWSYLSNVINVYNIKSPISHIRHLLEQQSIYPMKIRLKMATKNLLDIITSTYLSMSPFIEKISDFVHLSLVDRTALIEKNFKNTSGFSGMAIFRDADVYRSLPFKIGFPSIYGSKIMEDGIKIYGRIDPDGTLIKLLIPILIFSMGSDDITSINWNNIKDNVLTYKYHLLSNPKFIFDIQNYYIEIMFKYMIYRFGYQESALRFAALIQNFLDQSMCALHAEEIQRHVQIIQTIVEDTERSLAIQDQMSIESI